MGTHGTIRRRLAKVGFDLQERRWAAIHRMWKMPTTPERDAELGRRLIEVSVYHLTHVGGLEGVLDRLPATLAGQLIQVLRKGLAAAGGPEPGAAAGGAP